MTAPQGYVQTYTATNNIDGLSTVKNVLIENSTLYSWLTYIELRAGEYLNMQCGYNNKNTILYEITKV